MNKFFTILYLVIALYGLYIGITKKSKLYKNQNIPARNKQKYKELLSKFLIIEGIVISLGSVFELMKVNEAIYASLYLFGLMVFAVFFVMVLKLKKRD